MAKRIGIGLMGLGTVGYGVYSLLKEPIQSPHFFLLEKILIKDSKKRRPAVGEGLLTTDPNLLIHNPHIDIIVEVMGGVEPSFEYIEKAIRNKKHVVTANKLLLATHGQKLQAMAREEGVSLLFEASICGGIPIINALKRSLTIFPIEEILGIVNGTTNYILTGMEREGLSFQEALKKAIDLGYAEADPTSDISGEDAACKLAILSSLAYQQSIPLASIPCRGIDAIQLADIEMSHNLGYALKLIAYAKKSQEGLSLYVGPYLLHQSHPLATTHGVTNGVCVKNKTIGEISFFGPGAGMHPTAHAILSDIVQLADHPHRHIEKSQKNQREITIIDLEKTPSQYYLRFIEYSSSFLNQVNNFLPIISHLEGPMGLAIITEEIDPRNLQSLLGAHIDKGQTQALYRVKGADA